MTGIPEDDEFTELVDADFPRIDLVGKAANGTRFLIAKSAHDGGLFSAEQVRDMVNKSDSLEEARMTENATEADVVKADDVDLDAGTVLPDGPEAGASGADTMPGSPEWEALDAATARKWTAILSRAKNAVRYMSDREAIESTTGNGDIDAADSAWNLDEACYAIDYAISVLAPFAVGEQSEADSEVVGVIAKAMNPGIVTADVELLEGFGPVMKAGRVLSAGNEAAIRGAVDSLQKVLSSLPAPIDDVSKEAAVTAVVKADADADPGNGEQSPDASGTELEPAAEVAKADDLAGVSTADLKRQVLTGSTSERNSALQELGLRTLTGDAEPAAASADDGADAGAADGAAADDVDLAAAPAEDAGTPADGGENVAAADTSATDDGVAKAKEDPVLKGIIESQVKEATEALRTEHADVVKSLQGQIDELKAPAKSKVLTNGALPPAHQLRGQDQGSGEVTVAKGEELREQFHTAPTVGERDAVAKQMNEQASAALAALHSRR